MTSESARDRLAIVTVAESQASLLTDELTGKGFSVTHVDSEGSILTGPTISLFIGFPRQRWPELLEKLRSCCSTRRRLMPAHAQTSLAEIQPMMVEVEVGGATVYVLDVERFEQL